MCMRTNLSFIIRYNFVNIIDVIYILNFPLFNLSKFLKVPGYTRKENSQWLYSTKAIELIRNYMTKCPNLFERLAQNVTNDIFQEEELFDQGYVAYFLMSKYA